MSFKLTRGGEPLMCMPALGGRIQVANYEVDKLLQLMCLLVQQHPGNPEEDRDITDTG